MEGDESWESGIREGETLHEEALLIAVQAGYLIGHPVWAQDALIGLTGILRAYGKRNGCSENVKGSRELAKANSPSSPTPSQKAKKAQACGNGGERQSCLRDKVSFPQPSSLLLPIFPTRRCRQALERQFGC